MENQGVKYAGHGPIKALEIKIPFKSQLKD